MTKRYLTKFIQGDLRRKMVFLGGPRQVGKTTLALGLLGGNEESAAYFNFDHPEDRERLFSNRWPLGRLVVLDEIHKYRHWRNWLKGLYDKTKSKRKYLITGSARLDLYRRGGDSLLGRYHYYRLHPFSVAELHRKKKGEYLTTLLERGGFPEPLFSRRVRDFRRWRIERRSRVIQTDLRDLEQVQDVTSVEMLMRRLPQLVGSPLSIQGVSEDLSVAHRTASKWIQMLERLYYCYRIYPYGSPRIRAVKKEAKLYLWNWSEVEDPGARFENLVAGHLLKYCHFLEDTEGHEMELRYLRDTDGREVDFVVIQNQKPVFAVECKLSGEQITKSMFYFKARTDIPKFHLVHGGTGHFTSRDPELVSIGAEEFLKRLI